MSIELDRRQAFRLTVGVAAGLGAAYLAPAQAAASTNAATAGSASNCEPLDLPEVPGMSGDRKANEFWFDYDEQLLFHPPQELVDAYTAIEEVFGNVEEEVALFWLAQRQSGNYPGEFIATWQPLRPHLVVISRAQAAILDRYYGCDPRGLISAFLDFGQGVLFDPRRPEPFRAHIMNGNPPAGYHVWHAYNRALAFLGVDAARWNRIDRLVAAAWHAQSLAKPLGDRINPPLPRRTVVEIKLTWLRRSIPAIEKAFESVPYPPGVS